MTDAETVEKETAAFRDGCRLVKDASTALALQYGTGQANAILILMQASARALLGLGPTTAREMIEAVIEIGLSPADATPEAQAVMDARVMAAIEAFAEEANPRAAFMQTPVGGTA